MSGASFQQKEVRGIPRQRSEMMTTRNASQSNDLWFRFASVHPEIRIPRDPCAPHTRTPRNERLVPGCSAPIGVPGEWTASGKWETGWPEAACRFRCRGSLVGQACVPRPGTRLLTFANSGVPRVYERLRVCSERSARF